MSTNYPQGKLQTKFGEVSFAWTQADHVYLSGGVVVRGVEYNIGVHLHLMGGTWQRKGPEYNDPYISRPSSDPKWNTPPSKSARDAIYNESVSIWSAYAAGNAASGTEAERHHLSGQLDSIDGEIKELEDNLKAKRDERATVLKSLNKVGGHV